MLNLKDKDFLIELIADVIAQTHSICLEKELRNQWISANAEAAAIILESGGDASFFHWNHFESTLYGWSKEKGEICTASENACQFPECQPTQPAPCRHRALSRLVKNYFEFQRKPGEISKIDFADAVFFDPELSARQKTEMLNMCSSEGRTELILRVKALQKHIT